MQAKSLTLDSLHIITSNLRVSLNVKCLFDKEVYWLNINSISTGSDKIQFYLF